MNMIFRGDDARPGRVVLSAGRVLAPQDVGALAALGKTAVPVRPRLRVGLISTGDELVSADRAPGPGQMRDVNTLMLAAEELIRAACGGQGCALLLITHSLSQARRLADRVIVLHRGELVEQGPCGRVLNEPEQEQTRRFLDFYGK